MLQGKKAADSEGQKKTTDPESQKKPAEPEATKVQYRYRT